MFRSNTRAQTCSSTVLISHLPAAGCSLTQWVCVWAAAEFLPCSQHANHPVYVGGRQEVHHLHTGRAAPSSGGSKLLCWFCILNLTFFRNHSMWSSCGHLTRFYWTNSGPSVPASSESCRRNKQPQKHQMCLYSCDLISDQIYTSVNTKASCSCWANTVLLLWASVIILILCFYLLDWWSWHFE